MEQLISVGGDEIIRARTLSDKPMIGICVGMQILFDAGTEKGEHPGLGIFNGEVSQIHASILPHIGWNTIEVEPHSTLFRGIEKESFYFVHSYAAKSPVADGKNSWTQYGENFLSAVERGAVSAVQFHPEKSGSAGAKLISNWVETL
jgi:glutamine amidotransferase